MLKDVPVAPGAGHNLLRITRLLKMEYNVEGNKDGLQASKGNASVTLDCTIKAGIRYLLDIQLIPAMENECTRSKDEQNRNDEVGRAVAKAVPKTIDDKKISMQMETIGGKESNMDLQEKNHGKGDTTDKNNSTCNIQGAEVWNGEYKIGANTKKTNTELNWQGTSSTNPRDPRSSRARVMKFGRL